MPEPDTLTRLTQALGAKYEVRRLVGQGGFAEVYEVWDKELERRLAVKVLRPDVAWTAGTVERFQRETRAAAKLEHPNILPIHFVGEGDGLAYYAMPFVEGMSLGELLKRSGALPADRALAIIIPILDALDHAHRAGLLHRDVKPDNIMLDSARGRPLLVDFGIARRLAKQPADRFHSAGEVIRALEGDRPPSSERARTSAAQAATELLVSGATTKRTARRPDGRTVKPRRLGWVILVIALPALALGAGAMFFRQPTLVFENRLAGIVAVQVAGEERRLLPGGSLTLNLERGRALALSWRLVRPEDGARALGVPLGDSVTITRPRGRVRVGATASPRNGNFFAPLITNETGRPITITVNAGLAGALPCGCTVPPGAVRMEIGYYPLFANSTVRAEDSPTGRTATFRDLGPQVDAARGVVGLLFRAGDMR